ncbi:MAG: sulfatase-like hydrolase/transferase [Chloroflexota bacterium]
MTESTRRDLLKLSLALAGGALASRVFSLGQSANQPNALILLFDTLTAPHMSLYGYPRQTTPNLERFAERATVYHRHYSGGSYTIPGTASILTGLYPWNHRAINPSGPVRRDLADKSLFHSVGPDYFRLGFGQNLWADEFIRQFRAGVDEIIPPDWNAFKNPLLLGKVNPRDPMAFVAFEDFLVGGLKLDTPYPGSVTLGILDIAAEDGRNTNPDLAKLDPREVSFNEGFYYMNHTVFQGIAQSVSQVASRAPYLAYYHLFSPHGPYAPTREFSSLFDDGLQVPRKPRHPLIPKKEALPDELLDRAARAYDQLIANVDAEFGQLMDGLDSSGALEDTYVIVLSDHGQLFERGVHGHTSRLMYDQGIRVPLLIRAPGQTERRDVRVPTSNVDLLPTIASLTGGQTPPEVDGQILTGFGGPEAERPVFCVEAKESSAFRLLDKASFVLIRGKYKLIWYSGYTDKDIVELYDLDADPLELTNLAKDLDDIRKDMLEELTSARAKADEPYATPNEEK